MPNPVLRVVVAIIALVAALSMTGAGAGIAAAEPDDPGNVSEPDVGTESPTVSEPEPTTSSPPSIFDIPRTVANQLRDLVGKPLSIFGSGSGRVPGTHTAPDATTERKRDKPKVKKPEPLVLDPRPFPNPSRCSRRCRDRRTVRSTWCCRPPR